MNLKLILTLFLLNFSTYCFSQVYIGISYSDAPINAQDKKGNSIKKFVFLKIDYVANNSPAQKAGILSGDFICSVNKKDILSKEEFNRYISRLNPNDIVTLLIMRGNNSFNKEVVLERTPPDFQAKIDKNEDENKKYKDYESAFEQLKNLSSFTNLNSAIPLFNTILDYKPSFYKMRILKSAVNMKLKNFNEVKKDLEYLLVNNRNELSHQDMKFVYAMKMGCDVLLSDNFKREDQEYILRNGIKNYLSILDESDKNIKNKINDLNKNVVTMCPFCEGLGRTSLYTRCPNCLNWNDEYRSKVPCHECQDTRQAVYPKGQNCGNCKGVGTTKKSQYRKDTDIYLYVLELEIKNYWNKS
jgi:hypothetical protein